MKTLTEKEFRDVLDQLRYTRIKYDLSEDVVFETDVNGWSVQLTLDIYDQEVVHCRIFPPKNTKLPTGKTAGMVLNNIEQVPMVAEGESLYCNSELGPQKKGILGFVEMDAHDAETHESKLSPKDIDEAIQRANQKAEELRKSRELTPEVLNAPTTI